MSFGLLALVCAVALLGPLLSLQRLRIPVVIGELAVGIILGRTGFQVLDSTNPTLTFMGQIGFALVMFVAGSHVPVLDPSIRSGLGRGAARAAVIGVLAVPAGFGIARLFGNEHGWLFAVLLASSSAALVMPALSHVKRVSRPGLEFLTQLAVADTACIVALPLAVDPANASSAAIGTLAVIGLAGLFFLFLRWAELSGRRKSVHIVSENRKLTIELRVVLILLFALCAVAVTLHVSVMLAGFAMGLVASAVGEPKRVQNQMLALSEGFFAPIFFVWLGTELDLRSLLTHPQAIALGLTLGLAAIAIHALMALSGQPWPLAVSSAAQLGVPVAAAAVGSQLHIFADGEPTALLLGALVTIVAVTICSPGVHRVVEAGDVAEAESAPTGEPGQPG